MKHVLLYFLLISSLSIFSQTPSYYDDVDLNLTGNTLKDELATKITSTHTTNLSYTPGVWDALKETDLDANDSSKVILIYGWDDSDSEIDNDKTRSVDSNGGNSDDWNREHVFPKSLADPNLGTSGPGADAHNLRPCDVSRNSSRGNKKFSDGSGTSFITSNNDWYPGDEWKGDVARMVMYMYLRYGNQCLPSYVANGTANSSDSNMIDLLLEWNADDPVSELETQRNPILEDLQGNRNPFIDNPAFATQIWGGPQAEDLFGSDGGNNGSDNNDDSDSDNGGDSSNLLISEYIEGSSNNKAIEIANLTGATVDLSDYSIKKAVNGGGFSSTLTLSGQLSNNNVYVIAHSSASSSVLDVAQLTDTNVMSFNGNDAIGLFKNDVLVDLIGDPNSSSTFAQNVTLRRLSSITSANTTYTTSEWESLDQDTFDGLGSIDGSSDTPDDTTTPDEPTTPDVTYCTSSGGNVNYEYIDNVNIGGIANSTGANGGYGDFTDLTGNVIYGSNTIIISAGFASSSYTEYWKVWIDFNQDGTFDSNEEVVSGSSSSSGNLSYTFTIPTDALSGNTRMRVSMKWGSTPTSCEAFGYGEVEDYTVNISSTAARRITNNQIIIDGELGNEKPLFDALLYPNPSENSLIIKLKDNRLANYRIINYIGSTVIEGKIEKIVDVSNLQSGVYLIEINDGQRSFIKKLIKK